MKAVTLVVMRRKLLDAYDHAGAAYSAMTDKKERHVFEMLDAMSIAARAAGYRLTKRRESADA